MAKDKLKKIAQEKGYDKVQRHIFLCTHSTCNKKKASDTLWAHLKDKLKDKPGIARTKADCLRICKSGPIALVYPEGTLYCDLNKKKIHEIIDQHLEGGRPVKAYCFHEKTLG